MPFFLPVRATFGRRLRTRAALRAIAVLVALSVLSSFGASTPRPAAAGGSCTGWQSRFMPPDTIRVGRADGSVDVVDFRRYVNVVMAAEWPAWLPREAREAGAVAVKQYAWWYTLEGNHRSSYVNENGRCFDVKDSTADQLYKPEKVTVGDKVRASVDATWGLSVRKSDRFFLTGYRTGTSSVCASDVDGWKLFARSVIDCAERGWSRERIQRTYYAPDVTFHWARQEAAPTGDVSVRISAPKVNLRTGSMLDRKHARVTWDAADLRPAGTTYQLQRLVRGEWRTVRLADPTRPRVDVYLAWSRTHRFRVRLRDASGNAGPWYAGPKFDAVLVQNTNDRFAWTRRDWTTQRVEAASGGSVTYTLSDGSAAALEFTGRGVAVVATRAPDRGIARIYVDGQLLAKVNLYSRTYKWRRLVFTHEWSESARRVIRIEVNSADGRKLVDVDAVLFHR